MMNMLFLMDPLESINITKDTTFILMIEAHRRKHNVYFLPEGGILREGDKTSFHVTRVIPQRNTAQPFIKQEKIKLSQDDVHLVYIRTDPPFDSNYLLNSWLLDLIRKTIPIMNHPTGIRTVNEKIWVTQFSSIIPRTLIGQQRADLFDFVNQEHVVIAKPINGYGGQSIFLIKHTDTNANVILETLTKNWSESIILQKYIPESVSGDKRILLLNGEPLGAVLRVHASDDHRNNFFAGGKAFFAEITKRDLEIIDILKPELKRLGLYFVGIDIIGPYLVEVNVTSPTCLQEMNGLYGITLETQVIDFAEKLVEQFHHNATIPTQN